MGISGRLIPGITEVSVETFVRARLHGIYGEKSVISVICGIFGIWRNTSRIYVTVDFCRAVEFDIIDPTSILSTTYTAIFVIIETDLGLRWSDINS